MSKANLLRHPFGVSMTTFKLPDFASNGGNLLSKFIASYKFALPGKIAGEFYNIFTSSTCDRLGALPAAKINRMQLKLSEPLSFPKSNALRTAGIGFEIAFHQLQSLRVLFCGIRNNAIGRGS